MFINDRQRMSITCFNDYRLAADLRSAASGQVHGEFTEILLDDIQVFREYTVWRCVSRAWSGRTRSGLAFRDAR